MESVSKIALQKLCISDFIKKGAPNKFNRFLPVGLTVLLFLCVIFLGVKIELPTINEYWDLSSEEVHEIRSGNMTSMHSFTIEGLNQVRCYASSMAFKENSSTFQEYTA